MNQSSSTGEKKLFLLVVILLIVGGGVLLFYLFKAGKTPRSGEQKIVSARVKIETVQETTDQLTGHAGQPAGLAGVPTAGTEAKPASPAMPAVKPVVEEKPSKRPLVKPSEKPVAKAAEKPADRVVEKPAQPAGHAGEKTVKQAAPASQPSSTAQKPVRYKPWAVHIASVASKKEAAELKSAVARKGYKVYVTDFNKEGLKWYRVRVGFYSTRKDAQKAASNLAKQFENIDAWPVMPSKDEVRRHMN